MERRSILFIHDHARPMARASHHWLAVEEGFRSFVAGWRDVRPCGDGFVLAGGYEVLGPGWRRPISGEELRPAAIIHRKLVWGRSTALFSRLATAFPDAVHSYHPRWKSISFKWACEEAFREGSTRGISVARPATYLARRYELDRVIGAVGRRVPLIFKPSAGSMCRGIHLSTPDTFDAVLASLRRSPWTFLVVQELIGNTALFDGRKMDFRLYVLVTSFHPLRLVVLPEGVARVAAAAFEPGRVADGAVALTGCSYRKRRGLSTFNTTVTQALAHLAERGIETTDFWARAHALATDVFSCLATRVPVGMEPPRRVYLGGIDVLPRTRDGALDLLFLETNYLPQLNAWGDAVDLPLREAHRGWLRALREVCA